MTKKETLEKNDFTKTIAHLSRIAGKAIPHPAEIESLYYLLKTPGFKAGIKKELSDRAQIFDRAQI